MCVWGGRLFQVGQHVWVVLMKKYWVTIAYIPHIPHVIHTHANTDAHPHIEKQPVCFQRDFKEVLGDTSKRTMVLNIFLNGMLPYLINVYHTWSWPKHIPLASSHQIICSSIHMAKKKYLAKKKLSVTYRIQHMFTTVSNSIHDTQSLFSEINSA